MPQMPNIFFSQTFYKISGAKSCSSPNQGPLVPPFLGGTTPYVTLGGPPSRSIRTLSRVVLLSGTAEPGTCPPPLLHHVCLYSSSLSLSQFQSTDSTLLNMSDEEDYPDLDGYLDGYNRGYRDALRDYPSDEETDYSQTEGESGESEGEDSVEEEEGEDEDEDQTEPESEEEDVEEQQVEQEEDQWYQVERPHSPATCRSRCKTPCRFPVYGPPEPDADSDAESDDYESDYD